MGVIRVLCHWHCVIEHGVRSDKPSWAVGAGTAKDGATVRRISEGNPPLKYERPRLGFNTTRTARRNEFGLEKVCRRVSGSWCGGNNFTRRLEPAPQRPPLPKPQSFGFCRRHSIATTRSKRLLCFSRRTDQPTFGKVSDVDMESDIGKFWSRQWDSHFWKGVRHTALKHRPDTVCDRPGLRHDHRCQRQPPSRGDAVVTTPVEAGRRDVSTSSCAKLADVLCRGRPSHRVWSITTPDEATPLTGMPSSRKIRGTGLPW